MADFYRIQKFVALVNEHNTPSKKEKVEMNNLSDLNYKIDNAMKKDNALRDFVEDVLNNDEGYKSRTKSEKNLKAVEVLEQACGHKFLKLMTTEDNPRVAGEILIVELKGAELIRRPWPVHRFLAWLEFRNNLAVLFVAIITSGILANIDHIINFFKDFSK